jgi:hypothetical protein
MESSWDFSTLHAELGVIYLPEDNDDVFCSRVFLNLLFFWRHAARVVRPAPSSPKWREKHPAFQAAAF